MAHKLTPDNRDTLTLAFEDAGYQVKTINNRGDFFLAQVRKISDVEQQPNTPYEFKKFRKQAYYQFGKLEAVNDEART